MENVMNDAFHKELDPSGCNCVWCEDTEFSEDILMAAAASNPAPTQEDRHAALHLPVPKDEEKPAVIEAAEKAISAAIIQLLTRQPFFGQLLCSLRQVPTWEMPTMGVDGINLFFNPSFVNALA